MSTKRFQVGGRAVPLLRHQGDQGKVQHPSFISFVGPTMSGKSFLIRALLSSRRAKGQPLPVPAANANGRTQISTSSNIHLYADSMSAGSESPILFLDCEGFGGSEMPRNMKASLRAISEKDQTERRKVTDVAYPRLLYSFSTCIVFVTSLAGSADIKRRLIEYAFQGARGSINQGFKPSVFIIFNRFRDGEKSDSDRSTDASSAFFASGDREELMNFYDSVRVAYIPSIDTGNGAIALQQLAIFEESLRKEHKAAFERRRQFYLAFTPEELSPFLGRALERFSRNPRSYIDWAPHIAKSAITSNESSAILIDLWAQYSGHSAISDALQIPNAYDNICHDFERHVMFGFRLQVSRDPHRRLILDQVLSTSAREICTEHAPCGASSSSGVKCEIIKLGHGNHHQGTLRGTPVRWTGHYELNDGATSQQRFNASLDSKENISLHGLTTEISLDIRSNLSCLGCLHGPPSTVLACEHAFCSDCIRELTDDNPFPHRCKTIRCPVHQQEQEFSPRLPPIQSGYRIISLDGGGVKGLALLVILKHIEERCFDIPLIYLFDLMVGTSIGGQIALALNSGTSSGRLTVAAATEKFRELMTVAFQRKSLLTIVPLIMGKSKYKATPLERHLKDFFGEETKLFSASISSPSDLPNIAVTTVAAQSIKPHLVTNYNRKGTSDAPSLLFGPTPNDCMPVWAAARCTSAAVPYFKQLEWQGHQLVDGAFGMNCPAACAYSEAKSIWPNKDCDILLSLGTGNAEKHHIPPKSHKFYSLVRQLIDNMTDANGAWQKFFDSLSLPQKVNIFFRLSPTYEGTGYNLDDFEKLDDIEGETKRWMESATQVEKLSDICDKLIASLFFFRLTPDGKGEILCRLPAEARGNLVEGMREEEDSNLFIVEYDEGPVVQIDVGEGLHGLTSTTELRFRVPLRNPLPKKIHVKMRALGTQEKWLPISGFSYVI